MDSSCGMDDGRGGAPGRRGARSAGVPAKAPLRLLGACASGTVALWNKSSAPGVLLIERGNFTVASPTRRKRRQLEAELRPHLGPLWDFACTLAPRAEAADLVQVACLRAVERFDQLHHGSDVRAWLFTVLRNEFVSRWRRERRRATLEEAEPAVVLPFGDPCPDLEASLMERRWSEEIRTALRSLPETYRMPVYLKDVAGLAYREIADVLGCPIGTVMSRLARGRASLRAALARQAQERGIVGPARRERAVR